MNAALAAIPFLMVATEHWKTPYGALFILIALYILATRSGDFDQKTLLGTAGLFLLLAVPAILSELFNTHGQSHLSAIALIGIYALVGPLLLRPGDERGWNRFFFTAAAATGVAILILIYRADQAPTFFDMLAERRGAFDFEGIGLGLDPNYIGLMSVVVGLATAGLSSRRWRMAGLAASLAVAELVSSRDSILAISVGHAAAFLIRRLAPSPDERAPSPITTWFLAMVGAIVLLWAGHSLVKFMSNDVLLLNNPDRGLGSGFTNRVELWRAAWALWRANPVFGVGYGRPLTDFGYFAYAHNLVLVLLSETGLVGLSGFVVFCLLCVRNARRFLRAGQRTMAVFMIAGLAVYWSYGLFEGKAVDAGNPLSALFFLLMFAGAAAPKRA